MFAQSKPALHSVLYGQAFFLTEVFFFQAEDGIRDVAVTGVQTCALPISVLPPSEEWHEILKPMLLRMPGLPEDLFGRMRKAKLTFGDRVHCPFLRPVFLSPADEERVRTVAERIAELGERVVTVALGDKHIFAQLHLSEEEERLARIHVGYEIGRAHV